MGGEKAWICLLPQVLRIIKMKKIGLIGDVHGRFSPELKRLLEISEPDFCLQAGDYSCYHVNWPTPVYFITGNHEVMNNAKAPIQDIQNGIITLPHNNIMLTAGLHNVEGVNIVALPAKPMIGVLPGPALYQQEDYDQCWAVNDKVDIFISHGCGFPFLCFVGSRQINVEDITITKLIQHLTPMYAVSGHNHLYEKKEENGIQLYRMGTNHSHIYDLITIE